MTHFVIDIPNEAIKGAFHKWDDAAKHLDKDNMVFVIKRQEDLIPLLHPKKLTSKRIVNMYNNITRKTVKRMADTDTAVTRLWKAMQTIEVEGEKPVKTPQVPPLDGMTPLGIQPLTEKDVAFLESTDREETRGRKAKWSDNAKITAIVAENPRRKGTHGYKSMQIIMESQDKTITYGAYVKAGGRRQDLSWDLDKGHVVVE